MKSGHHSRMTFLHTHTQMFIDALFSPDMADGMGRLRNIDQDQKVIELITKRKEGPSYLFDVEKRGEGQSDRVST